MGFLAVVEFPTLVALGALIFTITFLFWRSQRYWARQAKDRSPTVQVVGPEARGQGGRVSAPDEVVHWEVQMHETARELFGQLDSKMRALAQLIREADRAAARLESALESATESALESATESALESATESAPGHAPASTPAATSPASPPREKPDPVASTAATSQASPTRGQPDPIAARPISQAEALKSAGGAGPGADRRGVGRSDAEERLPAERRYEEIYMLADYGFAPTEIARRVGSPVGEVELILGLRAKR